MNQNFLRKKQKTIKLSNKKKSIEGYHIDKLKYFENLQKSLPNKKKILKELNSETEIEKLKKEIKDIEERKEETEYFLEQGILLKNFLDKNNNGVKTNEYSNTSDLSENEKNFLIKNKINDNKGILQYVENEVNNNKKEYNKQYLKSIGELSGYKDISEYNILYRVCTECEDNPDLSVDGISNAIICENCGLVYGYDYSMISFQHSQEIEKKTQYSYKKITHFMDWVGRFQAKENLEIPEEVMEKLKLEISKRNLINFSKITKKDIRYWLKKIGETKYYEHEDYIINKLKGIKPFSLTTEEENILCNMFEKTQNVYNKYKLKGRKNFFSYPYILYKFCELLEWDDLLPTFRLLKNDNKLHEQDVVWKRICADPNINWEFYPTLNDSVYK